MEIINQREDVQYLAVTSGRYDAMATVWASSNEELYTLLREFAGINGVRKLETFICLQTIKRV